MLAPDCMMLRMLRSWAMKPRRCSASSSSHTSAVLPRSESSRSQPLGTVRVPATQARMASEASASAGTGWTMRRVSRIFHARALDWYLAT